MVNTDNPNFWDIGNINELILELDPGESGKVSDGYHTFDELYAHRHKLFVALCNTLTLHGSDVEVLNVWKSRKHSDGSMHPGMFIAGIGRRPGNTITYHLPMEEWDGLLSYELDAAPEWDGHRSEEVLALLSKI